MKDKNLPDDINNKSLIELTQLADNLIESLEKKKDFQNSLDDYKKLISLNNIIQRKFQLVSKQISEETQDKINKIIKNEK